MNGGAVLGVVCCENHAETVRAHLEAHAAEDVTVAGAEAPVMRPPALPW